MVKQVAGIWLPDGEAHLTPYLEKSGAKSESGMGSYQLQTLASFLDFVPGDRRGLVLDIGAHVGLWSMHLSRRFDRVEAFEPTPVMQECFVLNVLTHPERPCHNVNLNKVALSDKEGAVEISFELDNSGHTHVAPTVGEWIEGAERVAAKATTLDTFFSNEFGIRPRVDAIKIDVEGYEPAVIRGGEAIIRADKPIICIEQKPHGFYGWEQYEAIKILMGWGAKPVGRVVDDFFLVWE
jgi:FkbM family methyltransferase